MAAGRMNIPSLSVIIVIAVVILFRFFNPFSSGHDKPVIQNLRQTSIQAAGKPDSAAETLNRNEDHLILTRHARCRMDCRHITETEIKEILHDGNINYNKSELDAPRGPKYALEGYLSDHQHLRVIFAPEPHAVVVVTCIDLDNEWQCPSCN